MTTASLKIKLRDGTTECFTEPVGKERVDYEVMDKALNRLQEQSNTFLTIHVEKEKEMNQTGQVHCGADDNDDGEESSDEDDIDDTDQDKPPEKKPKL